MLAVAVTPAWPLAMVAEAAESVAEAPASGAVKEITPPSTGSTGLMAVTVTASGLANAVSDPGRLRGAAGGGREREALALEGADVDAARPRQTPLVGVRGRLRAVVPPPMAGLPGSRGMVVRRPAVVAQGRQQRVAADQVVAPRRRRATGVARGRVGDHRRDR